MINKKLKNFISVFLLISFHLVSYQPVLIDYAEAVDDDNIAIEELEESFVTTPTTEETMPDETDEEEGEEVFEGYSDEAASDLPLFDATVNTRINAPNSSPSKIASRFSDGKKITFNRSDQRDLEKLLLMNSALPELRADHQELSKLSGRSLEEIEKLNYWDREALIKEVENNMSNSYIISHLVGNPQIVADFFGTSLEDVISQGTEKMAKEAFEESKEIKIDKKVIETLKYLITPKPYGAGHWHIKVYRLRTNYNTSSKKYSKESVAPITSSEEKKQTETTIESITSSKDDEEAVLKLENAGADTGGIIISGTAIDEDNTITDFVMTEESYTNVSAHYRGMAADISEVDDIKCTVVKKRRIGSSKKEARPPIPIKLLWQTSEGYNQDKDSVNSSFNQLFHNLSQEALLDMLSGLNIDFANLDDLEASNFSDLTSIIGQALVAEAVGSPTAEIFGFNLEQTLTKLGGVVLADKLNLNREPFLDEQIDSIDTLAEALGRYNLEGKINLPYGSLKGNNRNQIFSNIGKQKILSELNLPNDILDYTYTSEKDFYERVGSRIVEEQLALVKGSFYQKDKLAGVISDNGEYKIKAILSLPSGMDQYFSLNDGTTSKLKNGAISPSEYCIKVAQTVFNNSVFLYQNLNHVGSSQNSQTAGLYSNWRDESYNLPEGTLDKFTKAILTDNDFIQIGKYVLASSLENNDANRNRLIAWLNNPSESLVITENDKEIVLTKDKYSSTLNINKSDFYTIFGSDNGRGAFKRIGKSILTEAVKNSSYVESKTREVIRENPEIAETIETYEFYKNRIETIKKRYEKLKKANDDLNNFLDGYGSMESSFKEEIKNNLNKMSEIVSKEQSWDDDKDDAYINYANTVLDNFNRVYTDLTEIMETASEKTDSESKKLVSKVNAVNYNVEIIAKAAYEIITGQEQNDFRLGDTSLSDISDSAVLDFGDASIGVGEIALLISGRIKPADLFITVGSAKLCESLNLPSKALKYASMVLKALKNKNDIDLKDAFFRAIGLAELEDKAGIKAGTTVNAAELGSSKTFSEFRKKLREGGLSKTQADNAIRDSFGLKGYNLDYLERGDFAAWSTARDKTEKFDLKYNLPIGTTEKFIKGEAYAHIELTSLSTDEIRELSVKSGISESAIKTFIAIKNGEKNPAINKIYYVDHNRYMTHQDSPDACGEKAIPNDSYLYYDADGMHVFTSYASANEYQNSHEDKKLDYLTEFVAGFKRMIGEASETIAGEYGQPIVYRANYNVENLKNDFEKFLDGKSQKVFDVGSEDYSENSYTLTVENLLDRKFDISSNILKKLLTSDIKISKDNIKPPVDFLLVLGRSLVKVFAADYLSQSLGLDFGSARVTADDMYEIFNGNFRSIFAKIGSGLLDEELGVSRGSVEEIILSTNSEQRKCSLERASLEMVGNIIGIKDLKLEGSLYDNFGGGKIESFLGLPDRSFSGDSLLELLSGTAFNNYNGVPLIDFLRAFQIPMPKNANQKANAVLNAISKEYYNSHKNKDFYTKSSLITAYVQALNSTELNNNKELLSAYNEYENTLESTFQNFVQNMPKWGGDTVPLELYQQDGYKDYEASEMIEIWNNFRHRISNIDTNFHILSGSTEDLLSSKITPNQYRKMVSEESVENLLWQGGGTVIINLLGLEDTEITPGKIRQFINAIKNPLTSPEATSIIFGFLDDLFSLNLDKKAGFRKGTFASIVQNPSNSLPILLGEGARLLDIQFDLVKTDGEPKAYSFSNYVNIYLNGTVSDQEACKIADSYTDCINEKRRTSADNFASDASKELVGSIISQEMANLISQITQTNVKVIDSGPFGSTESTRQVGAINMPKEHILNLFKGDLRPLSIIGLVMGVNGLIADDDNNLAVGEDFLFSYDDFAKAFYGNPEVEDYARQVAYGQAIAQLGPDYNWEYNKEESSNSQNDALPPNFDHGPITGITVSANLDELAKQSIEQRYGGQLADLPKEPILSDFGMQSEEESYDLAHKENYQNYLEAHKKWQQIRDLGEEAASRVQGVYQAQLEYKTIDCILRKIPTVGKYIPYGFTWAMLRGNGYIKSVILVSVVDKILHEQDLLPSGINLVPLYEFLDSPDDSVKGDLGQLSRAGITSAVDKILIANSPKILGMSLQEGTAGAIFAFIKSGDFKTDVDGFDSLDNLYDGDWVKGKVCYFADSRLGLPRGTIYTAYSTYDRIDKANKSLKIWSNASAYEKLMIDNPDLQRELVDTYKGDSGAMVKDKQNQAKVQIKQLKADIVAFMITTMFNDQIADVEQTLNLVPGTGSLVVGMLAQLAFSLPVDPIMIGLFVVMNLFGYYKTYMTCTADGHYPELENKLSGSRWYDSDLGYFNGMKQKVREQKFVEASQNRASGLIGDLLSMPEVYKNENIVPTQIMTGRWEDVEYWRSTIGPTICNKVGADDPDDNDGVCGGSSQAGLWANPKTTSYTHIGF